MPAKRGRFDGRVAVAAIDAVAGDVAFVAELDRLLARDVDLRHPRRSIDLIGEVEKAGDEEERAENADPCNRVRAAMKNLRHIPNERSSAAYHVLAKPFPAKRLRRSVRTKTIGYPLVLERISYIKSARPLSGSAERQSCRNGSQFFTACNLLRSESFDENLAHGRNERRPAGQKHVIDVLRLITPVVFSRRSTHARHQSALRARSISRTPHESPFFAIDTGSQWNSNSPRCSVRQRELRPPHRLVQPETPFPLDEMFECLQPLRDERGAPKAVEHLEVLRRVQERQMMPAFQAFVGPARYRQKFVRR